MILIISASLVAAPSAVAFLARPASWTPQVELVRVSSRRRS
jgi:hypothetical protein